MTSILTTSATNEFLQTVRLGREHRKQNIHVLICPTIDADPSAKSRAFANVTQVLDRHDKESQVPGAAR